MYEEWKEIELAPRYEVSNLGRIRKKNPKNGYRYLKPFKKWNSSKYVIKVDGKELTVSRLVANAFIRPLQKGDTVLHKNRLDFDNYYRNLLIMNKKQCGKATGGISRSKRVVLLEGDEIKRMWKSSRKAAKDLYISRQTVSDYCNNRTKKKMFNLMWEDDYFDKVFEKFSWEQRR